MGCQVASFLTHTIFRIEMIQLERERIAVRLDKCLRHGLRVPALAFAGVRVDAKLSEKSEVPRIGRQFERDARQTEGH